MTMKTSFDETIGTSWTLLADFTKNDYDKDNIQVLCKAAVEVQFAFSDSASDAAFVMPPTFTSLTTSWQAKKTRKLYAKLGAAGSETVYCNIF